MNFGLIIIGDEILSGKRADKHLAKAIEILSARGLSVAYADYVGDDPLRITATLRRAMASGDVVFSFGGIGATPDDHTRQCAAAALGVELALHPDAKRLILERMQDIAREQGLPYEPERSDNQHRLNMGMFPLGASIVPNPFNKIPGFSCFGEPRPEWERGTHGGSQFSDGPPQGKLAPSGGSDPHAVGERGGIHFLPGFPVMAWPMVEWVLDTHYAAYFSKNAWREQSVIVFGAMESTLTPLMQSIEAGFAVKVFSLPSVDHPEYGRHVELGVKGRPEVVSEAFLALKQGLKLLAATLGPELVR